MRTRRAEFGQRASRQPPRRRLTIERLEARRVLSAVTFLDVRTLVPPEGIFESASVAHAPIYDSPACSARIDQSANAIDSDTFSIDLVFPDDSLETSHREVFRLAAARWSELIVAGLPDVRVGAERIDDIRVKVTAESIDGVGGETIHGRPQAIRNFGERLPALAMIEVDVADIETLQSSGQLADKAFQSIGMALGVQPAALLKPADADAAVAYDTEDKTLSALLAGVGYAVAGSVMPSDSPSTGSDERPRRNPARRLHPEVD